MNEKVETEISSQDFSKNGWKLVSVVKDEKYNYRATIECECCGEQRSVNYYNFKNEATKTKPCKCYGILIKNTVGNTYGIVKVLEFDRKSESNSKPGQYDLYFKTQCTLCKKFSTRKYNPTQWNKTTKCQVCNSTFEESSYNDLLRVYKKGASERNYEWKLSDDEFLTLVNQNCHYCGSSPVERDHDSSKNKRKVMGIDRVDSTIGYVFENCRPCCTACNYMKWNYSEEFFINHIKLIYNHLVK